MVLAKTTLLGGRYAIQSVLGEVGPYDVSYLAWDVKAEREVVIREYFPLDFARRAQDGISIEAHDASRFEFGLAAYSREAELLSEFKDPNVVSGICYFQENGSTYRVSDHISGVSLAAHLKQQVITQEEQAMYLIEPLLKTLQKAHQEYLFHGALSPRTVFVSDAGQLVVLNFQMARNRLAQHCGNTENTLQSGYSPSEPLNDENLAAWDVYGCGALMFYLLIGKSLPPASDEADHFHIRQALKHNNPLSPALRKLLLKATAYRPENRPESISEYRQELQNVVGLQLLDMHEDDAMSRIEIGYSSSPFKEPASETRWQHSLDSSESPESTTPAMKPSSDDPTHEDPLNTAPQDQEPEMESKQKTQDTTTSNIPSKRPDYLPQRTNQDEPVLEEMLAQMVKRQQQFTMTVVVIVVLLIGIFGGIYIGPSLFNTQSKNLPQAASAETPAAQSTDPLPNPSAIAAAPGSSEEATTDESLETEAILEENSIADQETEISTAGANDSELISPPQAATPAIQSNQTDLPSASSAQKNQGQAQSSTDDVSLVAETAAESVAGKDSGLEESQTNVGDPDLSVVTSEISAEDNGQFLYLKGQGDLLIDQGQTRQALESYQAALAFKPQDETLIQKIETLRDSLLIEEQRAIVAESLRVRIEKVTDTNGIFVAPDTPAKLTNEQELSTSVAYPSRAKRAEVEGRVIVRMVVNEQGSVENPTIVQGIGFGCDEEVLRVLTQARFEAAIFDNEPVKAWFMYSLVFSLN